MCSLCWLLVAKKHNSGQILTFSGLLYRPPFTDEDQIWCARADPRSIHLQAKFHLNVFIVSASGGHKPQFWANFVIFGGSCTDPLLPMKAKFGVREQTQGLHLQAKFHLNVFIVSASSGQKPQFWQILTFLGAHVPTPFYR